MVCRLTAAKAGFEAARDDMAAMGAAAQDLQAKLLHNVDADTEAYLRIVAAYRLPNESADDKAARSQAIAAALHEAAEVPLHTASLCLGVLELATRLSGGFNTATASDLGVALQSAMCGVRAARSTSPSTCRACPTTDPPRICGAASPASKRMHSVVLRRRGPWCATWPLGRPRPPAARDGSGRPRVASAVPASPASCSRLEPC